MDLTGSVPCACGVSQYVFETVMRFLDDDLLLNGALPLSREPYDESAAPGGGSGRGSWYLLPRTGRVTTGKG